MKDKSRISLEYLKEFTEEELWAELKRRSWEQPRRIWSIPKVKDDGSLDMGVEDPPGTYSSVSWSTSVNWALLATRCEYVIDTTPCGMSDYFMGGDKGPYVYRKVIDKGYCHTHYVGSLTDPRVQALLILQPLGYHEEPHVIEWDVWKIPAGTDFKRWTKDILNRPGLPITAELHVGNITDHREALKQYLHRDGDGHFYMIRPTANREELWQAILRERTKTSLYEDW